MGRLIPPARRLARSNRTTRNPGDARTDGTFVAYAYLLHITNIISEISSILEKHEDATRYNADYTRLKQVFDDKYMTPQGQLAADTQPGLALALVFGLYTDPTKATIAATRLFRLVRLAAFKVSTGFAGTPQILHALTSISQPNLAYRMLFETRCPSWLYPITQGATIVWERWDSKLPDGSINPGETTSFNHYALGSVMNWLHQVVGGTSPLRPAGKQVLVRPVPGGSLTSAEVTRDTPYGRFNCKWQIANNEFTLRLLVPPNSNAKVVLPDRQASEVLGQQGQGVVVGSGMHEFCCTHVPEKWKPKAIAMPVFEKVEDEAWFEE